MIRKNKFKSFTVCLSLLLVLFIQSASHATDSMQFKVLAAKPLPGTDIGVYQDINELFASDAQLVLIAELDSAKNPRHLVKVQILNPKGEIIFDEEKELEAQPGYRKPYVAYSITLDSELRSRLIPGSMSIKLYLDGRSFLIKQLTYKDQNMHKKLIAKLIVLPFYSSKNQIFDHPAREAILSSYTEAVKGETQRYIPDVVSPDVVKAKLPNFNFKNCLDKPERRQELKNAFGDGIFIIGDIHLPKTDMINYANAKIFFFNSKNDEFLKFESSIVTNPGDIQIDVMRLLSKLIFEQKNFLSYMRSL